MFFEEQSNQHEPFFFQTTAEILDEPVEILTEQEVGREPNNEHDKPYVHKKHTVYGLAGWLLQNYPGPGEKKEDAL